MKYTYLVSFVFLAVGTICDCKWRRAPTWLSLCTLAALCLVFIGPGGGKTDGVPDGFLRLLAGICVYILFYLFYCFGMFGGGDGKAAALLAFALGLEGFLNVLLIAAVTAVFFVLCSQKRKGLQELAGRIRCLLQLFARGEPDEFERELSHGLQIPFIPFAFAGLMVYGLLLKGG